MLKAERALAAASPRCSGIYARHYQTGAPLPEEIVEKIVASSQWGTGFSKVELAASALLDLEWHKGTEYTEHIDVHAFEAQVASKIGLPTVADFRFRSTCFKHIFGGDYYAAGYYTYLWAETLAAEAFERFVREGIFNARTGQSFRRCILELRDSEAPMTRLRQFLVNEE